jgi:glycosyltransferase involved in cell wall biosynthesis
MGTESEAGVTAAGNRIRVCLLCDTVGTDAGTERQVIETAKRLDKNKFEVHVCCLETSPQLDSLKGTCQTAVFPTLRVNSWNGIVQARRFRRYLNRHRLQIVHAHMNKTAMFAVLTSLASARIVITSRLNLGYWYTPMLRRVFRLLNLRTNAVMANSQEAKRVAVEVEGLNPDKVAVVYQGLDMTVFHRGLGDASASDRLGIPRSSRVVGIVANLRPVKDIPLFLRAARIVAQKFDDVVFLVAGRGEQFQELYQLACELGLQDRVFFTRGEGKIMDYLSRMCIGCLTSFSEGFSNAVMEYMGAGLPVVATDVGGNCEAIVDGETGYLVRERTPEAFAKPLIHLLQNEDLRLRMGLAGFTRCTEYFEVRKTIRQLEQFYDSLATSRLGSQPN